MNDYKQIWVPASFFFLYPFRKFIDKADLLIAVSHVAAEFIRHFTKSDKVVVVPNGVDINKFRIKDTSHNVHIEFLRDQRPKILFVGRLVYRKGVHILVEAMQHVIKRIPDAHLLVVGEGYMEKFLRVMIKSLGLERNIKLLGYVPEDILPYLYSVSDVFVFPSLLCESFGITLLEAMASGTPIVASNVGGVPEIIEDEVTGLLVKRGDDKELAEHIIKLLVDRRLANEIARNSLQVVKERYSWPVIVDRIEELYEKVAFRT